MPNSERTSRFCANCQTTLEDGVDECPRCKPVTVAIYDQLRSSQSLTDHTLELRANQPRPNLAQDVQVRQIGDYEIIEELARGGMGVVYRARHQKLGREVAMKVILSGQFASANDVRRFELEAEAVASLDHPGIVPIYEIGRHDGHHFFTMKLIEGGSLAGRMTEARQDIRRFVSIVAAVAEAIDYAHRRGILHRDIKPANVLLDTSGNPVVTDLGLAKRTEEESELTGTGAIVGTPAYMSPEQASASNEVTTAADIYSIGAILYEVLTGRPPHKADSPLATLMLAANSSVRPPSELERKCDRTLELICMKCLARDPSARYGSSGTLAADLRCWLAGKPVSVRPKSLLSSVGDLVADQLSSAVGAVLIGVIGGFVTGLPIYSNLALGLFGNTHSPYSVKQLKQSMPQLPLEDAWWLHPPEWFATFGFLVSLIVSICLGLIIQKVVRPRDTRQSLAIGLVTGLLMTIVQFSMYGVAANWQTFRMLNAQHIDWLAEAGFAIGPQKQQAIDQLNAAFPDLNEAEPGRRAGLLSQAVSASIMLASPTRMLGIMLICLSFSSIYCVGGTIHRNRLLAADMSRLSRFGLYLEVMMMLTFAMATIVLIILYLFGMISNEEGLLPLPIKLIPILAIWIAGAIPAWKMKRWFYRWPVYAACVFSVLVIANIR